MLNILVGYTDITTPSVHKVGKKPVHVGLYQSVTGLFVTGFDRFLAVFSGFFRSRSRSFDLENFCNWLRSRLHEKMAKNRTGPDFKTLYVCVQLHMKKAASSFW